MEKEYMLMQSKIDKYEIPVCISHNDIWGNILYDERQGNLGNFFLKSENSSFNIGLCVLLYRIQNAMKLLKSHILGVINLVDYETTDLNYEPYDLAIYLFCITRGQFMPGTILTNIDWLTSFLETQNWHCSNFKIDAILRS